jgi:hypothetical protein
VIIEFILNECGCVKEHYVMDDDGLERLETLCLCCWFANHPGRCGNAKNVLAQKRRRTDLRLSALWEKT